MKKGVIFDIDGTLNRTVLYAVEAYQTALAKGGIMVSEKDVLPIIGQTPDAIVKHFFGTVSQDEEDMWAKEIEANELVLIPTRAKPFDGVPEMLTELQHQGYCLMICSNAYPGHIESVLSALKLRHYFEQIGSSQVGNDKTEVIANLLIYSGCGAACMVGDRIFDVKAAHNNHIPVIGCTYGYAPWELQDADCTVSNSNEIPGAVQALL